MNHESGCTGNSHETYNDADLALIVDDEGIGYAVQHYMYSCYVESLETRKLFEAARSALDALADHLDVPSQHS